MADPASSLYWPLARLMRPQGRRGELLAEALTDVREFFSPGLLLGLSAAEDSEPAEWRTLETVWWPTGRNAGRAVLKLDGCDSIDDAEALSGRFALARRDALPELPDGTFLVRDLIGSSLVDGDADLQLGSIVDVEYVTGADGVRLSEAAPLLVVRALGVPDDAEPVLVPFAAALLRDVDVQGRRIVMTVPHGLFASDDMENTEAQG